MDNRTSQLVQASFKGVEFSVRSESLTEGGRKTILHEYTNSSERFVEDQGQIPPKFSVTAFVHGENFKANAKRLESALNEKGSGKLILPNFGSVNVYSLPYSKSASQTSVGEIEFELEFAVGRPSAGPSIGLIEIQQVYDFGDIARQKIQEAFGSKFIIPSSVEDSAVAAFDMIAAMNGIVENYKDILPTENLETVLSKVTEMTAILPQLVRDPVSLAEDFIGGTPVDTGLWQEISIGLTGGDGLTNLILSTFFGGGSALELSDVNGDSIDHNPVDSGSSTIPLWQETTAQRISRNDNRLNTVNAQRLSAMVASYEVAADTNYSTQDEITDVRITLEDIHDRIMRDDTIDRDVIQSDDNVRSAVENIRLAALDILEQKEQEAFGLDTLDIRAPSSSFVQSYNLYAEEFTNDAQLSDRSILLRKLNPDLPAIALDNGITIFRTV